jgi:leader peptidase (prepilin peptidase)/N-methyltransferase
VAEHPAAPSRGSVVGVLLRWQPVTVGCLVFAGVLLRYGDRAAAPVAAVGAAVLVALSAVDINQRRVPNRIVLPATAVALIARIAIDPGRWWVWIAAAFGASLVFFLLAAIRPGALGMGDVKLALLIGALLGGAVIAALLIGTISAAFFGIALLARHGASARHRALPYAPFLSFGAILMLLLLRP